MPQERKSIMLTFDKVLEVFEEYIKQDTLCEIVTTSRGYTVMYWDSRQEEWYGVEFCKTPEVMRDALLQGYFNHREEIITNNDRELTNIEVKEIKAECNHLARKCK